MSVYLFNNTLLPYPPKNVNNTKAAQSVPGFVAAMALNIKIISFFISTPHRSRIQGRDPLGGGSRDKEAGEAPHGHGHRCPLSEVGQRQQHPVPHH